MLADLNDLLERSYRMGWNDAVESMEKATHPIRRDADAKYQTPLLLKSVRVSKQVGDD